jgi:hypothetical protein
MNLKISSLPTLAMKSPKKFHMVFTEFIKHTSQFLAGAVLTSSILCCSVKSTCLQLVSKSDELLTRQFPCQQDQTGLHLAINVPLLV